MVGVLFVPGVPASSVEVAPGLHAQPSPGTLAEVARGFSPRIESWSPSEVVFDLAGLDRLFGDARALAERMRGAAADHGLRVRVAMAGTRTAARLLARHRAGITIVDPGTEVRALAALPLGLLGTVAEAGPDGMRTLARWGLRTLGDLAALPADEVAARLGQQGAGWQRLARGEDPQPLQPASPEERVEQALDLEWPIEGLEPLSFVLARLLDPIAAQLERRGRGAAVLHVRLRLVAMGGAAPAVHERALQLPTPIRDPRTLRTLALLDLESHPPVAAIDRVTVAVDPTPGRVLQFSLLTRPLPSPEQISTLVARLQALMGETRCGAPALVDSWRPGAYAMQPFAPSTADPPHVEHVSSSQPSRIVLGLRRFRRPVPVRVAVEQERPAHVATLRRGITGGRVETAAGPWRISGDWWREVWDRDEWDVTLDGGATYRLFRERATNHWYIDAALD